MRNTNVFGWLLTAILGFMSLAITVPASAGGGGKVNNPVIVDEGECAMDISGIDESDCIIVSAPDQSWYVVFNCAVPVICPDEQD